MDRRDFAAEFPLEWALKDVDLAIGAAHGDAPPLLAALSSQWHTAVAAGHGRQDVSAARLALGSRNHSSPDETSPDETSPDETSPDQTSPDNSG